MFETFLAVAVGTIIAGRPLASSAPFQQKMSRGGRLRQDPSRNVVSESTVMSTVSTSLGYFFQLAAEAQLYRIGVPRNFKSDASCAVQFYDQNNTFGLDETKDIINTQGGLVSRCSRSQRAVKSSKSDGSHLRCASASLTVDGRKTPDSEKCRRGSSPQIAFDALIRFEPPRARVRFYCPGPTDEHRRVVIGVEPN